MAYPSLVAILLPQQRLQMLGDIHDLALLVGFDRKPMHDSPIDSALDYPHWRFTFPCHVFSLSLVRRCLVAGSGSGRGFMNLAPSIGALVRPREPRAGSLTTCWKSNKSRDAMGSMELPRKLTGGLLQTTFQTQALC